ncbi:MAG: hypothetical protein R3B13_39040 [Polyangiaceae bacterium]
MTNLAVPTSKVPPSGYMDNSMIPYLGGACIARSWNSGQTFAMAQCVSDNNHFYDGSSMAVTNNGSVFAAYNDVTAGEIDVWMAPGVWSSFSQLPNPFPGIAIISHPRIESVNDDVFVLAQANWGGLVMARYSNGSWSAPFAASQAPRNPVPQMESVMLSDRYIRLGPQFAFDVAHLTTPLGNDHIVVAFTTKDPVTHKLSIDANICNRETLTCFETPNGWNTKNVPGDQFHPALGEVTYFGGGELQSWKGAWWSRESAPNSNTVRLVGARFDTYTGARTLYTWPVTSSQTPCPSAGGYWGDYHDTELLYPSVWGHVFITPYSDSSMGCVTSPPSNQWQYFANHLHVSSVAF